MRHFALTIRAVSGCIEGGYEADPHVHISKRTIICKEDTDCRSAYTPFYKCYYFRQRPFFRLCVNVPFSILRAVPEMRPMVLWSSYKHIVYLMELTVPWEDVVQEAFIRKEYMLQWIEDHSSTRR